MNAPARTEMNRRPEEKAKSGGPNGRTGTTRKETMPSPTELAKTAQHIHRRDKNGRKRNEVPVGFPMTDVWSRGTGAVEKKVKSQYPWLSLAGSVSSDRSGDKEQRGTSESAACLCTGVVDPAYAGL